MNDKIKVAIVSDTHSLHNLIKLEDNIDLIIHCGDFSETEHDFEDFLQWYGNLDIPNKILIAGNHDYLVNTKRNDFLFTCNQLGIIYLQDSFVELFGYKFYGTPWTVNYGGWHFMKSEKELIPYWRKIDRDTDVLIVHGPPFRILDEVHQRNTGCQTLKQILKKLKNLEYMFFGHIHEAKGYLKWNNVHCYNCAFMKDLKVTYVELKKKN